MQVLPDSEREPSSSNSLQQSQKVLKGEKIDYREKNLDHIQKLKQKKQKEQEDKEKELKKETERKEKLKKKILLEAQKVRELKEKENSKAREEVQLPVVVEKPKRIVCESLPKQGADNNKDKFKKRHSDFLNSLSQGIKTKKELEEGEKRKKEQQYQKLKEEMGINKISSKLTKMLQDEEQKRQVRSVSLEGNKQPQSPCIESIHGVTSKGGFQDKYSVYIQNLKKRKLEKQQQIEEKEKRMEKQKQKLKDYVLTTVKKNVLDGVYDEEEDEKRKLTGKRKVSVLGQTNEEIEEEDDEESAGDNEEEQKPKKKRRKMRNFPFVVDIAEWRKKNRLDLDTQVFIVTGGYGGIKKALYQRGWVQNPDPSSPCFTMKWVLQSRECEYNSLQQDQIVNHFQKNGAITTKIGLSKNLRGVKWVTNVDADEFYPKCFDMCDDQDLAAFEEQFKICKAITILKLHMKLVSLKNTQQLDKIKERTKVAFSVLQRNIVSLDDLIDKKKIPQLISKKEWEIMAEDELNTEGLAKKKHQQWLMSINLKYNDTKQKKKDKKKKKKKQTDKQPEKQEEQEQKYDEFTNQVNQLLLKYQTKYPQYNLTNTHNIWILKPAGLSRGRGITCFNNLVQILDHIKSKQSQWVAQKYIENPLIVHKRKFDIRLWVLVTSFNPLIIWKFDECYIRFSALDYNVEDVGNKFIHLTNNSIACMHKSFDKSEIKGNMFSQEEFSNYLKERQGYDVFEEKIKGEMINIIKWSMMAGQEHIEHRKNSHQLYGYDFMIDQDYKVWLIEINSSPSMDFSTHITTRLVKTCLSDIVKVVIDYNQAPKKDRKKIDTGAFKLIYKGIEIPDKHITTGLNLGIEGVQLKKGKKVIGKEETSKNLAKDNKNL